MDNRIKDAFDAVQTPEQLKRSTKAMLRRKTFDYGRNLLQRRAFHRRIAAGLLSAVLVLTGSGLWFLPATRIAVDINPSIEIRVNSLERVICVEGMNEDGTALARELDVAGMQYDDAVQRILLSNRLEPYLDGDHLISITVAGRGDETHIPDMVDKVLCRAYNIAGKENVFYCQVDWDTVKAARKAGLNIPCYLAWQRLRKASPEITPEDILKLSREQIRFLSEVKIVDNPCHE